MGSISLRLRLIGLVVIGMVVSLALGGAIACVNASRSVQTEMRAALAVARQAVETVLTLPRGDLRHELESVIAAFDGNRHVRLRLSGAGAASAAPRVERPTIGRTIPGWFARLMRAEASSIRLPVAIDGSIQDFVLIETDPHNELLETWNAFWDTLMALMLFAGTTFTLIYVFVGRALRPLDRLGEAFADIATGNYAARMEGLLAPELSRLSDRFNAMASQLAAADAQNRQLTAQLLTLQEAERREIARDLHDEFGPCLFAVNVGAANVARLVSVGRPGEIPGAVRGITDAVGHMQKQLRSILVRLRPGGLAEFGLAEALRGLIESWRQRQPGIAFVLGLPSGVLGFSELIDTTVYRLVQESLSNAVRHGEPTRIDVSVAMDENGRRILVEIRDDGRGVASAPGGGFGLLGMAERVRGLGGTLTSGSGLAGGFVVRAALPVASFAEPTLRRQSEKTCLEAVA